MSLVVIPKFSFPNMLKSIERHKINYIPYVELLLTPSASSPTVCS